MFTLSACWILYFLLHSVLAANTVKYSLMKVLGVSSRAYRILYNLYNSAALFSLIWLWIITDSALWFQPGILLTITGAGLSVTGLLLMLLCFKNYDVSSFIGIRREVNMTLNQGGLNQYIRHPLYAGTILLVLGICIAQPYLKSWLIFFYMLAYLIVGIWLEERKLVKLFGNEYSAYQKKTKRLIPFFY